MAELGPSGELEKTHGGVCYSCQLTACDSLLTAGRCYHFTATVMWMAFLKNLGGAFPSFHCNNKVAAREEAGLRP